MYFMENEGLFSCDPFFLAIFIYHDSSWARWIVFEEIDGYH